MNILSNQGDDAVIAAVKAVVSYGDTTVEVGDGEQIGIPTDVSVTVTFPEVEGYKTPAAITFTNSSGGVAEKTGTYQTEVVTVSVSADNSADMSGQTVTINGTAHTWSGTAIVQKVPFGTSYSVSVSDKDGYITPSSQSFTANQVSRSVSMVYEEIKAETLTVNVTGISSGYTVTVKKSDGTTIGSQTTATKEYSIEAGTQYYVTASSVSGYIAPSNSATRTAVAGATHTVVMSYVAHSGTTNPTNGVYIQDTDGFFHTSSEWDGTYTANGIAVITSNCRFVMALADAHSTYCEWGSYGTEVSGITTTTSESTAQGDYDGEGNTVGILAVLGNDESSAPAAYYCSRYVFPNGRYGYMGAAGEWQAALDNKSAITTALSKCGGTAMSSYYWTSTQCSSDISWCMDWDYEDLYRHDKSNTNSVRAFAAI